MSEPNKGDTPRNSIDLNSDIGNHLVIHKNITQEIVIIYIDRLKLILNEHQEDIKKSGDWVNPLGIFMALLLANLTASFHDFLGISAAVWEAIFLVLTIASFIYFIIRLICAIKTQTSVDCLIDKIKANAHENGNN